MVPKKQINDFVGRLQKAAGSNLESVILYGSAASGDFHPEYSDLNLLCILRELSYASLEAMAPAIEWWNRQKQRAPLLMSHEEIRRSADVFAIELMDIQEHHRVLLGEDVLKSLQIPMHLHHAQLEYELREKLILLRQRLLLAAGNRNGTWDVLLHALPTFATLFRHTLIAQGDSAPDNKREAVKKLAARLGFDGSVFEQALDVREHKVDPKKLDVRNIASHYLAAVEQVTVAVDRMLDSAEPRGS